MAISTYSVETTEQAPAAHPGVSASNQATADFIASTIALPLQSIEDKAAELRAQHLQPDFYINYCASPTTGGCFHGNGTKKSPGSWKKLPVKLRMDDQSHESYLAPLIKHVGRDEYYTDPVKRIRLGNIEEKKLRNPKRHQRPISDYYKTDQLTVAERKHEASKAAMGAVAGGTGVGALSAATGAAAVLQVGGTTAAAMGTAAAALGPFAVGAVLIGGITFGAGYFINKYAIDGAWIFECDQGSDENVRECQTKLQPWMNYTAQSLEADTASFVSAISDP